MSCMGASSFATSARFTVPSCATQVVGLEARPAASLARLVGLRRRVVERLGHHLYGVDVVAEDRHPGERVPQDVVGVRPRGRTPGLDRAQRLLHCGHVVATQLSAELVCLVLGLAQGEHRPDGLIAEHQDDQDDEPCGQSEEGTPPGRHTGHVRSPLGVARCPGTSVGLTATGDDDDSATHENQRHATTEQHGVRPTGARQLRAAGRGGGLRVRSRAVDVRHRGRRGVRVGLCRSGQTEGPERDTRASRTVRRLPSSFGNSPVVLDCCKRVKSLHRSQHAYTSITPETRYPRRLVYTA